MTRAAWIHASLPLLLAACAQQRAAPRPPAVPAAACASVAAPGIGVAMQQELERASNVLEYENVWRASGPGATHGSVNGAAVQATIRAHLDEIQACYQAALQSTHESGGRVVVRFVIDASGHVPHVAIAASELRAPELGCCVVRRVAAWTFPEPEDDGSVVVEYPFVVRLPQSASL